MVDAELLDAIRIVVREEVREGVRAAIAKPHPKRTRSLVSASTLSATVVPASELDMARARALRRRMR